MCDTHGVIYKGRRSMNQWKEEFATSREDCRTLGEALVNADCFIGVSVANALKPEDVKKMAPKPIYYRHKFPKSMVLNNRAEQSR